MLQSPKKTALWALIASVAVSALLGIWAILSGEFGTLQARVLMTTLTITGASVCGLACGALWETGKSRALPLIGIALAIGAAGMLIFGIWFEPRGELMWKLVASTCFLAVATGHVCLLSLARLAPRFVWAMVAAYVVIYLLAALGIFAIFGGTNDDTIFRAIGVVAILVGAVSLIVPVFHRLSAVDFKAEWNPRPEVSGFWDTITCPQCGVAQANSRSAIECGNCGCVFRITMLRTSGASPTVP